MSGHNKWSQIKEKKGKEDAKKSKLFSMLSRAISLEAKAAKGDKNAPSLRAAIDRARAGNMPNDNIERAITKGSGQNEATYEEVVYEAYGPGGVAMIIEGITDNKNRTTQEIKHLFTTHDLALGAQGSALWAFAKAGEDWQARNPLTVSDEAWGQINDLVEELEDHPDIKRVFTSALK